MIVVKRKPIYFKLPVPKKKSVEFDELISYLQKQKNKTRTIRLALLLAKKQFGDTDLSVALTKFAFDNLNFKDPKRIQAVSAVTNVIKSDTAKDDNKKATRYKPINKKDQPSSDETAKSRSRKKNSLEKHDELNSGTVNSKKNLKKKKSNQLSPDDINKMLWDGDSSDL
ncbi:Uncharacterised protein [Lactobacillus acidophilus]|nr:Uncharacterised protein [Lactobacillus acidophilus]